MRPPSVWAITSQHYSIVSQFHNVYMEHYIKIVLTSLVISCFIKACHLKFSRKKSFPKVTFSNASAFFDFTHAYIILFAPPVKNILKLLFLEKLTSLSSSTIQKCAKILYLMSIPLKCMLLSHLIGTFVFELEWVNWRRRTRL